MKKLRYAAFLLALVLIAGCSSPQVRKSEPVKKVEKIEERSVVDTGLSTQTTVTKQTLVEDKVTEKSVETYSENYTMKDAGVGIEDPFIENGINWSSRTITATGIGAPNPDAPNMAVKRAGAINAAKMVALRDLLATLKGMYLTSETTVENYMTTSDVVKTQVEGIAKAYRVVGDPKYFDDGSVEVTVEMSMNGELSDLLTKNDEFGDTAPLAGEAKYKLSDLVGRPEVYTGLIIDCRAVQVRPALSPKIFSKSGEELYGSANVHKDFAIQQGMLGYLKSVDSAKENARVANNPMVITAIGVKGSNKSDIIISDADAAKIKELDSKLNFLKECRVVAIVN
jgi:hypothetical protein